MIPSRQCYAGRSAFFGGKWDLPCVRPAPHVIVTEWGWDLTIDLCDEHFQEAVDAGHVENPYVDKAELERMFGPKPEEDP